MRRLSPILLLLAISVPAASCASSAPKKSLDDMDIDVLWEKPAASVASTPNSVDPNAQDSAERSKTQPGQGPALVTSTYYLTWQGKRIGEARESFLRSASGIRLIRNEEIRVMRSGVLVESETEIVIEADNNLHATRLDLRARAGAVLREGSAIRADDGSWVISLEGEAVRKAPASAVPLELVPYIVGRDGSSDFRSKVLLAGYGFAVTDMSLVHGARSGKAILSTEWGDIETDLVLAKNGSLVRAATGSTGAFRVGASRLKEKFLPPELPGQSTIAVRGKGTVLVVENVRRQPPPAIGIQSVSLRKNGWMIHYDSSPPTVSKRVTRLAREVDRLLQDSHDAPGAGAAEALRLGRGDCTAHSTLFVQLAQEQGIEAKLVTGYRLDGTKLYRHRWAAVRQGSSWVQVDPTFGEATIKPGSHLALAIHGDSTAQIALVDEAVFRGLGGASAHWSAEGETK